MPIIPINSNGYIMLKLSFHFFQETFSYKHFLHDIVFQVKILNTKMAFKKSKGPRVKRLGRWQEVTVSLMAVFGGVIVSELIYATIRQRINSTTKARGSVTVSKSRMSPFIPTFIQNKIIHF